LKKGSQKKKEARKKNRERVSWNCVGSWVNSCVKKLFEKKGQSQQGKPEEKGAKKRKKETPAKLTRENQSCSQSIGERWKGGLEESPKPKVKKRRAKEKKNLHSQDPVVHKSET